MKAIFINHLTIARDSGIAFSSDPATWRLAPATLEATRLLDGEERLLFLFGGRTDDGQGGVLSTEAVIARQRRLVEQIEAGGGRIDAVLTCSHWPDAPCQCWGKNPALLWLAATRFDLHLEEAYVLGDDARDVDMAAAVGARPLVILCGRRVGDLFGDAPPRKDFPIAENLSTAVEYIAVEEDIAQQWGRPRENAVPRPIAEEGAEQPDMLPSFMVTSSKAEGLQAQRVRAQLQMRDIVRWLSFLVIGAVGLSLGIAYLLTHLYRVQPFPPIAYYVTLQFIPRPLRGALFILFGLGIIAAAFHSWFRLTRAARR